MLYLYIIFFVKNVLMSDVVRRSSGIEEIFASGIALGKMDRNNINKNYCGKIKFMSGT